MPRQHRARLMLVFVAAICVTTALSGCKPEPVVTASPTPTTTASVTPSATPSASPTTPTPTEEPTPTPAVPTATVPATCDGLYSPEVRANLDAGFAPLNDPGISLLSTQDVVGLEILASGVPSMRCTWGVPSEHGLATTVATISAAQGEQLATSLTQSGYNCEVSVGALCLLSQQLLDYDGNVIERGEAHYLRDNVWIATTWVGQAPEQYTVDIVNNIWRTP